MVEDHQFKKWFEKTIEEFAERGAIRGNPPFFDHMWWFDHKKGVFEVQGDLVGSSIDDDVEDISSEQDDSYFLSKYLKQSGAEGADWIHYSLKWIRVLESAAIIYPVKLTYSFVVPEILKQVIPRSEMLKAAERASKKPVRTPNRCNQFVRLRVNKDNHQDK